MFGTHLVDSYRGPGAIVLVDLDGVLLPGDTMAAAVLHRLNRRPFRYILAIPVFLFSLLVPALGKARPKLNRMLVRIALRGVSEREYAVLAESLGRRLAKTRRATLIAALLASPRRIVVITASERILAQAFLRAVGLGEVELLASTLVFTRRGAHLAHHNYGEEKPRTLAAYGIDAGLSHFMTDSMSDLPLVQLAADTTVVGACAPELAAIRRGAPGALIREWNEEI